MGGGHDSGEDASTDKRLAVPDDANTSVCAMEFDGAGRSPVGLTSAASPVRPRTTDDAESTDDAPASDARTLRPPPSDSPTTSAAVAAPGERPMARLDETPLGVPEVGLVEDVSSVRHLRNLAQSSSQNELPVFRRVEFEGGRPVHIGDVAEPGRARKSEAPPEGTPQKLPPMAHASVSASQLVNLNSVVMEDAHRAPSKRPPAPDGVSAQRHVAIAIAMFLLGVGTTLLIVWLVR